VDALSADFHEEKVCQIIDAAIEAGVKRFFPSEFGPDTIDQTKDEPLFERKRKVLQKLRKESEAGKISFTVVQNGLFSDWGLESGILGIDLQKRTARIINGEKMRISSTHRDNVGDVVALSLLHPEKTQNKIIRIAADTMALEEYLKIVEEVVGHKFERKEMSLDAIKAKANEAKKNHDCQTYGYFEIIKMIVEGKIDLEKSEKLNNDDFRDVKFVHWRDTVQEVLHKQQK